MNAEIGYRPLRYGIFTAGLLLAGLSFLVYLANALAMEGARSSVASFGIWGMIGGSVIAGMAIITGALMSRRLVSLAVVILGGLASAAVGWLLGTLMFGGGSAELEWKVALCFTPVGMWLGLLAGASRNRVVVRSAIGGTSCGLLAAVAFPILLNMDGPPPNDAFWALTGLLIGGFLGSFLGPFIAWSRSKEEKCQ